jgi:hypothetical protein
MPQVTQWFPVHTPPFWQAAPLATHTVAEGSQHPPVQALPAQQDCPGPPHVSQTPTPLQLSPEPQASPAQQGCPAPPQAVQTFASQTSEALPQLLLAQQG